MRFTQNVNTARISGERKSDRVLCEESLDGKKKRLKLFAFVPMSIIRKLIVAFIPSRENGKLSDTLPHITSRQLQVDRGHNHRSIWNTADRARPDVDRLLKS